MFNGIIESLVRVSEIKKIDEHNLQMTICLNSALNQPAKLGDSIALNGVCLTVDEIIDEKNLKFILGKETLDVTSLKNLSSKDWLNLETAMRLGEHINGHLLSGHIDGIGKICSIKKHGESHEFRIFCPEELTHYIAKKGSLAVDGVSLTINDVSDDIVSSGCFFTLNIIPFTYQHTLFSHYKMDDEVNIEVDLLARYIYRQLQTSKQ